MTMQPSSRTCFVCGRENPLGLAARWVSDRELGEVRATLAIPEHFNGFPRPHTKHVLELGCIVIRASSGRHPAPGARG